MEEKKEPFQYFYSARDQEEIRGIRNRFAAAVSPGEETDLEKLRRLDRSATRAGLRASLALGILGCLLFGIGLCCVLIPEWEPLFYPGIGSGVVGMLLMLSAYPVHMLLMRRKQKELAPEVLRLSADLLK